MLQMESFSVDASCSRKRPWCQIQEILPQKWSLKRLKGRKTERGQTFFLLGSSDIVCWLVRYCMLSWNACRGREPSERWRERNLCHPNTKMYELPLPKACCDHRLLCRPEGTLFAFPLFSDIQWSETTSGEVCELTSLSQGKLSLRVELFQVNTKEEERKAMHSAEEGVMLQTRRQ